MKKILFTWFDLPKPVKRAALVILLFIAAGGVFSPLFSAGELNWDDSLHSYGNELVTDGSPGWFTRLFFTADSVNQTYIPLTLLSFRAQHLVFGDDPHVSHRLNVFLHVLVVMAVFTLGKRLGLGWVAAAFAAALFAFHPMHVEPVAWITSRKDTLYGFFYILGLIFYLGYLRSRGRWSYALSLLCAGISILAKPMAMSFPLILFLIDSLERRKFSLRSCLDKIPFFLAVEPVAMVTYWQNSRLTGFLFPESLLVWVWSGVFYVAKFFWPLDLSPLYSPPTPVMAHAGFYYRSLLIGMVIAATTLVLRRNRWVVFAVGYYVLSTFFLWRTDGGDITITGDRFMYIPSVGFCLAAGAGFAALRRSSFKYSRAVLVAAAVGIIVLAGMSFRQAFIWKECSVFWNRALLENSRHSVALTGWAQCLSQDDCPGGCDIRTAELVRVLFFPQASARHLPLLAEKQLYFQFLMIRRGFRSCPEPETDFVNAMGHLYSRIGAWDKALLLFRQAQLSGSSGPEAMFNEGAALLALKDHRTALRVFERYVRQWPDDPHGWLAKAKLDYLNGDKGRAYTDALAAFRLAPDDPQIGLALKYFSKEQGWSP